MTTTADAFLADIIAEPDDDALRLIYADWLDDHGETERAELIRVQCRLWRLEHGEGEQAFLQAHIDSLRRREAELLHRRALDWFAATELPGWWAVVGITNADGSAHHGGWTDGDRFVEADFRRGFVEAITLSADDWLRHADALTAAAPIRDVTLTTEPDWISSGRPDDDPREYFLLCGPQRRARRWSYEQLRLHLHDDGRPNAATSGGPWRRHVAARLLAAEWPRIAFTLPS